MKKGSGEPQKWSKLAPPLCAAPEALYECVSEFWAHASMRVTNSIRPCLLQISAKSKLIASAGKGTAFSNAKKNSSPSWPSTQTVTLSALQQTLWYSFFEFAWGFGTQNWGWGFWVHFQWSLFSRKQSTTNPQRIRRKFGAEFGAKFGTIIQKFRVVFVLELVWPYILLFMSRDAAAELLNALFPSYPRSIVRSIGEIGSQPHNVENPCFMAKWRLVMW